MSSPSDIATADVIVVLGGGISFDGHLSERSHYRLKTGEDLYFEGLAPRVHFAGAIGFPDTSMATRESRIMERLTRIPKDDLSIDDQSYSTLQNALYARDFVDSKARILVVSQAFHLPRAYASFRFMGFKEVGLVAAPNERDRCTHTRMILREGPAWAFNLLRAGLWWATGILEWEQEARNRLLI